MFMQSGLVTKWRRDSEVLFKLEEASKQRKLEQSDLKVKINLRHLQMPFLGLMVGCAASALVFIAERMSGKIKV
jgi:hypothetical protein